MTTPSDVSGQYLIFSLDEHRFAVRLGAVERVLRAVEVTPLPGAPEVVQGVINMQGEIVAVYDLRRRLALPRKEIDPADQLVIARTPARAVALMVDAVMGIDEDLKAGGDAATGESHHAANDHLAGVIKWQDTILFIYDLEVFLSPDEENNLDDKLISFSAGHETCVT